MELLSIFVGLALGLVLGAVAMYLYFTQTRSKTNKEQSESELKSILAVQARDHIDASHSLINQIQQDTERLQAQLNAYEASLLESDFKEDDTRASFYGEHASVYLRNTVKTEKTPKLAASTEAPPRDFSSDASGLFAGAPTIAPVNEEKTSK
ncbi:ZapG family protein [Glaciecola sp. KUL10]|uniref:ZapG family protein n=1 Tax=Glaciecola sp. (strain KUL10) TaxID=2161813 RepID=UPI000D787FE0|nr:DUF1043 family protein [Glaciecola sp. KUL10]GBL04883.1 hypothetical protein KUL10_21980 [Glaciecola sp. KUL10]